MIGIDVLVTRLAGLQRPDLDRWIAYDWIRPDGEPGGWVFHDIDVARVQLILSLRDEMQVNEEALPVVLSLLDQLYDLRRHVRELGEAIGRAPPEDLRRRLEQHLARRGP